ncbi:type III-B CRISPR module RAMP protein Cmr1 [Thermodesulfobacterium hveragerdense]|uniref:type III-B CRISPR module RAMP protein Cmr1 n=1 Tax=Thermodesulfobacterium hveragerdense TaxID=53424 RepID=UPI0003F7D58D|nr:type III-B CRISPR module RAMP protein Cmr1 [Thermodesulfobacterium hveragerdense]
MHKVEFKCEVITPMFMAGADGRTPELRPSEFKGMMRFWWRAIKAENDIPKLKKEEAEIFGGTGKGEGKSKLAIKLKPLNLISSDYWPLPHKKNFKKMCFREGSQFIVELAFRDKNYQDLFSNLFILTTILGGFGGRSRRGFGSVKIIEPDLEISYQYILNLLNEIGNSYKIQENKIINSKNGGQYPWIKEIVIFKEYEKWEKLLINIGKATHTCKDSSLGNSNPRMASPIYVSVIKKNKYI